MAWLFPALIALALLGLAAYIVSDELRDRGDDEDDRDWWRDGWPR